MFDAGADRIAGFYTLCASSIAPDQLPPPVRQGWPPYEELPAFLLGRLAVDQPYHGQGLGWHLLASALRLADEIANQVAAMAVVVDALDERAKSFYRRYGFEPMIGRDRRLLIPMKRIERRIEDG
jgi:GNAT superfamily N-acetyltransferase